MRRKVFHMAICLLLSIPALAQTQVEVITKTIKDQMTFKAGYALEIEGKSANIYIQTWDKNEIGIELKLISKGLTRAIAERELKYQKYIFDEINHTYVIRNYLLLPQGLEKLSTIQETEMSVFLPKGVELSINNSFGNTTLNSLSGKIVLESEYGELSLNGISGTVRVTSTFGDLQISNYSGSLTADLEHTATEIDGFNGDAFIKTNLGDIHLSEINKLTRLKIAAEKSDISLQFRAFDLNDYYWVLRSKYGAIEFPIENEDQNKITLGDDKNPSINIATDFGKITINQ